MRNACESSHLPVAVVASSESLLRLSLLLCIAFMTGCAGTGSQPPDQYACKWEAPFGPQFNSIDLANGVDAWEADLLVGLYFSKYVGECGAHSPVFRMRNRWHSNVVAGPRGQALPDITVDAKTSVVRMKKCPDSKPPWPELRERIFFLDRLWQR